MAKKKRPIHYKRKEYHNEVIKLIKTLFQAGLSQNDIADETSLYQSELSQLYNRKIIFSTTKIKKIKDEISDLVSKLNEDEQKLKKEIKKQEVLEKGVKKEVEEIEIKESFATKLIDEMRKNEIKKSELIKLSGISYPTLNLILNGITQNPHSSTKRKINKGLKEWSKINRKKITPINTVGKKSKFDKYVHVKLNYEIDEILSVPNKIGVYIIHDNRGFPTYIGKGRLKNRLLKHKEEIKFAARQIAATFSYYVIEKDNVTKEELKQANEEALFVEKLITTFSGNTVLLNIKNKLDLTSETFLE